MPDNTPPDQAFEPDPIDQAYIQAETLLGDEAARSARRARVLAAVVHDGAATGASASGSPFTPPRRSGWMRGRWLAAACAVGVSLFVVGRTYQPFPHQEQARPTARSAAPRALTDAPAPATPASGPAKPPASVTAAPPIAPRLAAPPVAPPAAPRVASPVLAPEPLSPNAEPAVDAPAPPAAPPPPPPVSEVVVTAERRADAPPSDATSRFSQSAAKARDRAAAPGALAADPGERLRAAATAGRVRAVEALLNQGAPVDAPDADGNTALMMSIRAGRPSVAALLYRHGADPDRENRSGESARDMATAKGDPALSRAIGLDP